MINKVKLSKAFRTATTKIIEAGGTHIKVELEAQLDRGSIELDCSYCSEGWLNCDSCAGSGYQAETHLPTNKLISIECISCGGDGYSECGECNGRGQSRSGMETSEIQDWLESRFSSEFMQAIVYGDVYDDGSVDTEYTFTLPTDKCHLVVEAIQLFNDLGSHIGNGLDTSNAGMHISVLTEGNYPCKIKFNESKMCNFRTEVSKLLPALYFLATPNDTTRSLEYRQPKVSDDDKYSAIFTHGDTTIEYRIFDTCYEHPEKFLENIEVIAHTLKYYSTEKTNVGYKDFHFFANLSDMEGLKQLYSTIINYDALHKTLPLVKPNKTIKRLREERDLKITKRQIVSKLSSRKRALRAQWKQDVVFIELNNERIISRAVNKWRVYCSDDHLNIPEALRSLIRQTGHNVSDISTPWFKEFVREHPAELGLTLSTVPTLDQYVIENSSRILNTISA